ncbi:hypothetical protein [Bacteriovorax sp. BSW11_IV]|uniref:hypothetical protein n=1 Tax=Bacteriovorax sp. BSW11_IV TaxID=1353529 RepID=UPI00041F6961|nr:hypothetical protein [Bacteriovorax sp. BSW11_IV]
MKFLKKIFKTTKNQRLIKIREEWGTPEENAEELIKLLTVDFEKIRNRKEPEHIFIGQFLSIILLIEAKLIQILKKYEIKIEDYTFGRKVDIYKSFLKDIVEVGADIDVEDCRRYIAPLKELAKIRNNMAHDLSYVYFNKSDLSQTIGLMKSVRPDLCEHEKFMQDEKDKCLVLVMNFGFQFSTVSAKLAQHLA